MPHKNTVLVVDDLPSMHRMISTLLNKHGYRLEFASSGAEALLKAGLVNPDLVLLDVMLPDLDGFEVCRRLRANPRLAEIPVIMVTALGDRMSRLKGLQAGADDFVTKPFDPSELGARVSSIIRLNRYRRLLAERARFEHLIELSPDGLLILAMDGRIELANPSMRRMLGLDEDSAATGRSVFDFVEASQHGQWKGLLTPKALGQGPRQVESIVQRQDGLAFPVEINAGQFEWDQRLMVQVVVRDITGRKQVEEALRQRNRELALINHASHVFGASLDFESVVSRVLDEMRLLYGVAGSLIWLIDDDAGELMCWRATGPNKVDLHNERLAPGEGLAGWTFVMAESLLVSDAQLDSRHNHAIDESSGLVHRSVLSVPLVIKSRVFGVLQVVDREPGRFDQADLRMAEALASIAAIAVENALLFRAVNQQRSQLRALSVRLGETQETERQQLAAELHDRIGQNLTALGLNMTIIAQHLPESVAPAARSRLEDSMDIVSETARRVRDVMAELRPPMLDDYGLLPALRWTGEQFFARTGVEVSIDGPESDLRMPSRLETTLFRIAQEALNNVAKHAKASQVRVFLEVIPDFTRLGIADDGVGFDPSSFHTISDGPHWGLLTMQERAASVGGRLLVSSAPGQGTLVTVEIERREL